MNRRVRHILIISVWLVAMLGGHLSAWGRVLPAEFTAESQNQVNPAVEQNCTSNITGDEYLPAHALYDWDSPGVTTCGRIAPIIKSRVNFAHDGAPVPLCPAVIGPRTPSLATGQFPAAQGGGSILAATRLIPNTGVAKFDRLAAGTDEFQALLKLVDEAGITIKPGPLPGNNPAYFLSQRGSGIFKTFFYDPATMTHIDTQHESIHLEHIFGGLRYSLDAEAFTEPAAYNFEAQLGLEYSFSDEYINHLQ